MLVSLRLCEAMGRVWVSHRMAADRCGGRCLNARSVRAVFGGALALALVLATPAHAQNTDTSDTASAETATEAKRPFANSEAVSGSVAVDPSRGPVLWRKCRACHTLEPGERHRAGPNLHGFFGKAAAVAEGYRYSQALIEADITWTDETLDAYLKATQDYVPGSKMYGGLAIERDRRDLIAWLKVETAK